MGSSTSAKEALTNDTLGAFCRHSQASIAGKADGKLSPLTFAAKDVFDVAGFSTGGGHPEWLQTHKPATRTAPVLQALAHAGASLVGKTHSDELCYSLSGENIHYGTPLNPVAPSRIPGGSSSGSAAAVAGQLVDFALGTDCGGSVRVPASYCGLFGIRPTHGRISLEGIFPFAPSFDTVGWFTRSPDLLAQVGKILLKDRAETESFNELLIARDVMETVNPNIRQALAEPLARLADLIAPPKEVVLSENGLQDWGEVFRVIQAAEIWQSLGDWIQTQNPTFGPGIRERFAAASTITADQLDHARTQRAQIVNRIEEIMGPRSALCIPTTPRPAPLRGSDTDDLEIAYRNQALNLLCIAGLGGLPQISVPVATVDGAPVGLSFIGRRGQDTNLIYLAKSVT